MYVTSSFGQFVFFFIDTVPKTSLGRNLTTFKIHAKSIRRVAYVLKLGAKEPHIGSTYGVYE